MSHAHFMTARDPMPGSNLSPLQPPETPAGIHWLADRADEALRRLARLQHDASLAEWVEVAAPIAKLILAARTI